MISFTIPSGTYESRSVSETIVKLDRGFSEETQLSVHASSISDWPRQEVTAHGINSKMSTLRGSIKVRTVSDHLDIIKYFESLKGSTAITLTYPDAGTKSVIVSNWTVGHSNSLYSNISLNMEVVY